MKEKSKKAAPRVALGLDKVQVWLTRPISTPEVRRIDRHCGKPTFVEQSSMKYTPLYQQALGIHQPGKQVWPVLKKIVGRELGAHISYAEFALDIIFPEQPLAESALARFLASAQFPYQRPKPTLFCNTYYFAPRASHSGKRKTPDVPVVYADKPSKLASPFKGEPCLHIERRISGAPGLATLGVSSIEDIESFDHRKYWKEHLRMYEVPSMKRLGEILRGRSNCAVGDEALRKRAREFRAKVIKSVDLKSPSGPAEYLFHVGASMAPALCQALSYSDVFTWIKEEFMK